MKMVTTGKDGQTEREEDDQVLTFQEGEMWIAAWRHYDMVAQGKTQKEAFDRLLRTMGAQCMWDAIDGNKPFAKVPPPPPDVLADWERRHRERHHPDRNLFQLTKGRRGGRNGERSSLVGVEAQGGDALVVIDGVAKSAAIVCTNCGASMTDTGKDGWWSCPLCQAQRQPS